MKKALAYLAVAVLVLVVLGVAGTFLLPRVVVVERSVHVDRPPCTVFAMVNGFGRFNEYSPWARLDPATKYTFSGPAEGPGAAMAWSSDDPSVGNGAQDVVASHACESVEVALHFEGMSDAAVAWKLTPKDGGTDVTWSMTSDMGNNPIGRVMGTQLDGMIGPDYEKGLASLATLVAALPPTDFAGLEVERVEVPAVTVAKLSTTAAKDPMAVGAALGMSYAKIRDTLTAAGLVQSGSPRAAYRTEGTQYAMDVMLPFTGTPSAPPADPAVSLVDGFTGPALKVVHRGATMGLSETVAKLDAWAAARAVKVGDGRWEEYLSDPSLVAEPDLQTAIYLPLAP
ncbi:MAG: SRPBCC family protein [Myxococcota bacterium]